MRIVVIGYGRVGSRTVARLLSVTTRSPSLIRKPAGWGAHRTLKGIELVQGNA